jgi:hypothetical protein
MAFSASFFCRLLTVMLIHYPSAVANLPTPDPYRPCRMNSQTFLRQHRSAHLVIRSRLLISARWFSASRSMTSGIPVYKRVGTTASVRVLCEKQRQNLALGPVSASKPRQSRKRGLGMNDIVSSRPSAQTCCLARWIGAWRSGSLANAPRAALNVCDSMGTALQRLTMLGYGLYPRGVIYILRQH